MTSKEVRRKLAQFIADNPQLSYKALSLKLNCAISTVATIAREYEIRRQRPALTEADLTKLTDLTQKGE
jgi:hypothetical protein